MDVIQHFCYQIPKATIFIQRGEKTNFTLYKTNDEILSLFCYWFVVIYLFVELFTKTNVMLHRLLYTFLCMTWKHKVLNLNLVGIQGI
jgi:hypothetical protein